MTGNLHIIQRQFAARLMRNRLHTPHLLARNHFLAMRQQWQDDIDTADLPPAHLVYGMSGATGADKANGKTADCVYTHEEAA